MMTCPNSGLIVVVFVERSGEKVRGWVRKYVDFFSVFILPENYIVQFKGMHVIISGFVLFFNGQKHLLVTNTSHN